MGLRYWADLLLTSTLFLRRILILMHFVGIDTHPFAAAALLLVKIRVLLLTVARHAFLVLLCSLVILTGVELLLVPVLEKSLPSP